MSPRRAQIVTAALWGAIAVLAQGDQECPMFVFEKSYNSQNVLQAFARVDDAGELIRPEHESDFIGYYWLMNGRTYKPVHPLIKSNIRERLELMEARPEQGELTYCFNDLKELKHDLTNPVVHLRLIKGRGSKPAVEASIQLGASYENQILVLSSIYSQVQTRAGLPVGVDYVELRGTSKETGKAIHARYYGKQFSRAVTADSIPLPRLSKGD